MQSTRTITRISSSGATSLVSRRVTTRTIDRAKGPAGLPLGGTAGQLPFKAGSDDYATEWRALAATDISDSSALGRNILQAASATAVHALLGLGAAALLGLGTTAGTVAAGDHSHAGVYAAISHTHFASDIWDSTVTGRSLITAADAPAARTVLGLGSMATQNASAVTITGGTISGVTSVGTGTLTATGKISTTSTAADSIQAAGGVTSIAGVFRSNAAASGGFTLRDSSRSDALFNLQGSAEIDNLQIYIPSDAYAAFYNGGQEFVFGSFSRPAAGVTLQVAGTGYFSDTLLVGATLPISTEKIYCNGDGRFSGGVTASTSLDAPSIKYGGTDILARANTWAATQTFGGTITLSQATTQAIVQSSNAKSLNIYGGAASAGDALLSLFGSTHPTAPGQLIIRTGAGIPTVTFDTATQKTTLAGQTLIGTTTAAGSEKLRVNGTIRGAIANPGTFADVAAIQSFLNSIFS